MFYFAFTASLMLSLLGLAGGIWADKFDHIAVGDQLHRRAAVVPLRHLLLDRASAAVLPEHWRTSTRSST